MNTSSIKSFYRIDVYLVLCHALLLLISYGLWTRYPHLPIKNDMSGLFFMIISILGGVAGLIFLSVALPRLDVTLRNLSFNKFFLALLYWISSTAIFVMFGISKFFFNSVTIIQLIFIGLFFSSIYFSIIHLADMRKKDWLILSGIFGSMVLFFFLLGS